MGLNDPPKEVDLFQRLWFSGLIIGAGYDFAVSIVSEYVEAGIDIIQFAVAVALMYHAVQRRSRLARVLLIPFLLGTVVEVFSHQGYAADVSETFLALLQLTAMSGGVWLLYTPAAERWYSEATG